MVQVRQRRPPASAVAASSLVPTDAKPKTQRRDRRFRSFLPRGWPVVVGFCAFYVSAYATVTFWHTWLPEPKGLDAPRYDFSEARARTVLEQIMRFGYRPVGTKANEELTPQYLLQQVGFFLLRTIRKTYPTKNHFDCIPYWNKLAVILELTFILRSCAFVFLVDDAIH